MNLVEKLLTIDNQKIKEKMTSTVEIERLTKLTGEPFFVTIQEVSGERYQEISAMIIDRKGRPDFDKTHKANTLLVLEGVVEPNLKDEKLQKHFGAATPKDLAEVLFQGGAMSKLADGITKLSGFTEDDEEKETEKEIKN